ncbi:hypothetical protein CR513_28338, partial [Mucuna pruriens]
MKDLLFVKKMHLPVCGFIRLFVDDNVYNHIASEIDVKILWKKIESLYASKGGNNKLFLLNSIVSLKFKEDTSLSNHLNEFQGIIDQMSGMGIKFEDEILGLLLLNSLPESWETFKVSITNSAPNGVVPLQMVKGSVLNEEMRKKAQGSSSQSEVLVTENRGRSQKKEREKSRSKYKSRYKNVECHYCYKIGHIQKHCFLWKKENRGKKGKSKEKDDDRVTIAIGDGFVIFRDFESVNFVSDESMWIIDSGATLHVTPRKEFFTSYTVDVRFNLISVHMLDDGGYDNHFGHRKWKLTKDNLVVARGEKISKLYWTKALVAKDSVNAMDMEASLWHRRLSHISEKGLTCLAKKDMLSGLKNAELEKCSHCMTSKQTRVSFKKHPPSRKSELLELVHSDVCGPLKVKSFSGALYFVTFIDDCSRKLWVYVLKTKDQVLEKFKQFQALVERQSGKKVKCICSDNGGEYCGPFDVYYRQQGIRHEKTPPKTPQLNGLVERMNRTLIERVRCMLSEARLPKHFWGEALYTAVHQLGDGFDVPLDDDVEEEQEMSQDENLGDAPDLLPVQLRRSNRQRQSSTRYTFDEYVILTDGEEIECYEESMESEERQKAWQSKLQKYAALSTTKAERFLQVRRIYTLRCVTTLVMPYWWYLTDGTVPPSHHQKGDLFPIRKDHPKWLKK